MNFLIFDRGLKWSNTICNLLSIWRMHKHIESLAPESPKKTRQKTRDFSTWRYLDLKVSKVFFFI